MINGIFKKLSMVQITVSITSSIALIVDSIIISRYMGLISVAAVGLISPVAMLILAFSGVLSSGGQLGVGKKLGRGDVEGASKSVSLNLALIIISSAVVILAAYLFTEPICLFLGAEAGSELLQKSENYLRGFILGMPGMIGMLSLIPIMNMDGDKKRTTSSAIISTIGDIVLDLLSVYIFPNSIFAIGLASAISYLMALIVLLGHFFGKNEAHSLHLTFKNLPWHEIKDVIYLGSPAALQKLLRTMLSYTINCILLAVGSEVALASYTIIYNIGNLVNSVGQGLSAATLTIAGVMYGERIKKNLSDLYKAMIKYSVLWNLIMLVVVMAGANFLAAIFTTSKSADASMVAMGLRFFSFDFIFYSICLCAKSYYQGVSKMKVNYIITVFEGYICIALSAWVLGTAFGLYGVCIGFAVGDALSMLSILIGVTLTNHRLPSHFSEFLLLPSDYEPPAEDVYFAEVTDMDDVVEVSRQVNDFVSRHAVEQDKAGYKLALAVEELGKNVLSYGFSHQKDGKLEVRVIYKDERFILQIKDNGQKFSPVEYMKINADAVKNEKYKGIPLVFGVAKDIRYYSLLDTNKVVIEL